MSTPLAALDVTTRVLKRAQYEAFAFTLTDDGVVVRNESHADPDDHEYIVTVRDGVPVACECPADDHYESACKHRVGVAIREPILDAVRRDSVAADGGRPVQSGDDATGTTPSEDRSDAAPDDDRDCDCDALPGNFPCWECVRTGRRELPDDGEAGT